MYAVAMGLMKLVLYAMGVVLPLFGVVIGFAICSHFQHAATQFPLATYTK